MTTATINKTTIDKAYKETLEDARREGMQFRHAVHGRGWMTEKGAKRAVSGLPIEDQIKVRRELRDRGLVIATGRGSLPTFVRDTELDR